MPRLPILKLVLVDAQPTLDRLSPRERKAVEHAAFYQGAVRWFADYGPLRFARYAWAKLNYTLKSGHLKRKKNYGVPEPLVWSGETREAVLSDPRIKVGGPAGRPWVDAAFRLPGPRSPIVYEVLGTILDTELGGFAEVVDEQLAHVLDQAQSVGGGASLSIAGATSRLGGARLNLSKNAHLARETLAQTAEDRRVEITEALPAHRAATARRLKRTHDRWRRQSGGSAPTGGVAQSYLRSTRYRRARSQADHRTRYR